ncbi:TIC236, chloroplastic-like protein [Drosera capensis]
MSSALSCPFVGTSLCSYNSFGYGRKTTPFVRGQDGSREGIIGCASVGRRSRITGVGSMLVSSVLWEDNAVDWGGGGERWVEGELYEKGLSRGKEIVKKSFYPLWEEGERIQREVDFGKVREISPMSITLESCLVGPHSEEFSRVDATSIKLRVRPFAGLRRGKFVTDAVLSQLTLLVAQKKDFTWLGLPSSDGIVQRRFSTEDGIDFSTRTRRAAREEAVAHWYGERDESAKLAAEMGYNLPDGSCSLEGDVRKDKNDWSISKWEFADGSSEQVNRADDVADIITIESKAEKNDYIPMLNRGDSGSTASEQKDVLTVEEKSSTEHGKSGTSVKHDGVSAFRNSAKDVPGSNY